MNKAYFTFLMMRFKWITFILLGANIVCIALAFSGLWHDVLFIVQGATLILWGKADADRWEMVSDFEHMLHMFTTHNANEGIVPDSDLQGLHVFVRRYPWAMKGVKLELYKHSMSPNKCVVMSWQPPSGLPFPVFSDSAHKELHRDDLRFLKSLCK